MSSCRQVYCPTIVLITDLDLICVDVAVWPERCQGPKAISQNQFLIECYAFPCLHESLYCAVSRSDSNYLTHDVRLDFALFKCV